jgi:hypothetical protein
MTEAAKAPHRYAGVVNMIYLTAALMCAFWVFALLLDAPGRVTAAAFTLTNALPLVAFVLDIWHTEPEESK